MIKVAKVEIEQCGRYEFYLANSFKYEYVKKVMRQLSDLNGKKLAFTKCQELF